MNKTAYITGYMEKNALSFTDIQKGFNKVTVNPAIRTALLAGGGFLAGKYGSRLLGNYMANKQFSQIQDPRERAQAWEYYKQQRGRRENVMGGIGALALGAIPAIDMARAYAPALRKFRSNEGSWSDLTAPMLNNRLPQNFDKFRMGAKWLVPAAGVTAAGANMYANNSLMSQAQQMADVYNQATGASAPYHHFLSNEPGKTISTVPVPEANRFF